MDCHTAHTPCEFTEIHEKMDPVTGATLELNPQALKTGDVAIVTLKPVRPMSVETFPEYPALGAFVIRNSGETIVGRIQSVVKKD